jgi:hypothetical protein
VSRSTRCRAAARTCVDADNGFDRRWGDHSLSRAT